MYGDLVEWLEKEIKDTSVCCCCSEYEDGVNAGRMLGYEGVLNWIKERRSKSYTHKCKVEMEEAAKKSLTEDLNEIEDYFKDKTQDEIMEIVRRNGGSK